MKNKKDIMSTLKKVYIVLLLLTIPINSVMAENTTYMNEQQHINQSSTPYYYQVDDSSPLYFNLDTDFNKLLLVLGFVLAGFLMYTGALKTSGGIFFVLSVILMGNSVNVFISFMLFLFGFYLLHIGRE